MVQEKPYDERIGLRHVVTLARLEIVGGREAVLRLPSIGKRSVVVQQSAERARLTPEEASEVPPVGDVPPITARTVLST